VSCGGKQCQKSERNDGQHKSSRGVEQNLRFVGAVSLLTTSLAVAGLGILLLLAHPGSYASYLLGVVRAPFPNDPPGVTVKECWDALGESRRPHRGFTLADLDAVMCLKAAGLPADGSEQPKSTPPQWEEFERQTLRRWTIQIWRWWALWIGIPFLGVIIGTAGAALGLRRALLSIKALGP